MSSKSTKSATGPLSLLLAAVVVVLGYLFYPAASPTLNPTVVLPQGTVRGVVLERSDFGKPVEAFRGIPYALPPVGPLRFARAQPVPDSNATINALDYGPRCPGKQLLVVPGTAASSEDCLTVNVFRPMGNLTNLPVAV